MDSSDSDGDREELKPAGVFSEEVHETLRALHRSGMVGWGKKHPSHLKIALARTGLNLSQIKVGHTLLNNPFATELDKESKYA